MKLPAPTRSVNTLVIAVLLLISACENSVDKFTLNDKTTSESSAGESMQYVCPMHPQFTTSDGASNCPICGMAVVAADPDRQSTENPGIVVPSEMIQTMGVRTTEATFAKFGQSLRAFGTVETDERRENVTASRLEGWVSDLRARAEGDSVQPGALLYRVYSPDLISAQKDYLNALRIGNAKRIAAVRQRMRSVGMQGAVIGLMDRDKSVIENVPVYAEAGGIVSKLSVRDGDYIKPGSEIMRIQSYTKVWVIARVPEQDLALVSTGLQVKLLFPSAPSAPAIGSIDYIYPTIDAKTRTGKVRIEVDNANGHLRPGAYANVSLDLGVDTRLSIPDEAILWDSRGSHVVIALGEGRFDGRKIQTGISAQGQTEIVSGLSAGEKVVVSGQFLLDSEVNLQEGLSKFTSPSADENDPHSGHRH